ncbi:MAG: Gmad2 immunoglobulin-like domain-containing protein [Gemmatimonadota bacterium]|nr:Gmad2 immunoglobulin-like domain-containing protein [Gemmatimonadota bacterium]
MKKPIVILALVLLAVVAAVAVVRFSSPEDSWLCQENGLWVAHGQPSAPKPEGPCGPPSVMPPAAPPPSVAPARTATSTTDARIQVTSPIPGQAVASPLTVTGRARGNWYFEASFPVELRTVDGRVLAQTTATAQGEWMTENFVPFIATLDYTATSAIDALVVLKRDNPSGLPANDAQVSVPVHLDPNGTVSLQLYFGNSINDPNTQDCGKTFPVTRNLPKTDTPARAALVALLSGPTEVERTAGYFSSINPGVTIRSLVIDKQGTARVDFDTTIGQGVGGSCRVSAIRSQIISTLKQFPTVKEVVIAVDGNVAQALQP